MIRSSRRRSTRKSRPSATARSMGRLKSKLHIVAGLLISGVVLLVILLFIDRIVMPVYVRHGSQVKVPDLRYLPVSVADSICSSIGLKLQRSRERVDDRFPEDSILDQHPMAGSIAKPGRVIDLTVSVKDNLALCPDVVGRSPREAELLIKTAGLSFPDSSVQYASSYHYPKGVVMAQFPAPMVGMLREDTVRITVSSGPPVKVTVPDLVGMELALIDSLLLEKRLRLGGVVFQISETVDAGIVISHKPAAGTAVQIWSSVNCTVSTTPAQTLDTLNLSR